MNPLLSVILCAHNPRRDYLARTLAGLRAQSFARESSELIIVDNSSREPVANSVNLAWSPNARIVCEPHLGLTSARLRGIAEAKAPVLLFVDDDNVLAVDYLERARAIAAGWPQLGVWGCGRFTPEWEESPAPELAPALVFLAVHEAPRDRWSNQPYDYAALPAGAGLCARTEVARHYAAEVLQDGRRRLLDRTGTQLSGCGDFDLGLTAIELGYGTGVFRELALTHLMPRGRVQESYLLRLAEEHACSTVLLMSLRGDHPKPLPSSWLDRIREYRLRRVLGDLSRKLHDARRRGEARAWGLLAKSVERA